MQTFSFKKLTIAILGLSSLATLAHANTTELDEISVTATRLPQKTLTTLSDISIITEDDIAKSGVQDLPNLLKRTTGLEVSSSGGPGTQSSLFTRGTNGNHTVVLIDGVRIVSATTGQAAFNHIPLNQIERIEVVRGAASSVYGADAVGGVIQIFTKKPENGAFNADIGAGIGNRNTYEVDANVSGKVGKLSYQLSGSHNQTKGFSATNSNHPWGIYNPDKDGYKNSAFSGSLAYDIADGHQLIARALQDRGVAEMDAITTGQDYNRSALHVYSLESQNKLTDNIQSNLQISRSEDLFKMYSDNDIDTGFGTVNTGHINTKTNKALWTLTGTSQYINWLAGAEWQKQKVDSNTKYSENSRTNKAIFAGLDFNKDRFLIESNLRYDDNEKFGNQTTGRAAFGYQITDNLTARLSYGTSFRAPTFNDLYYPASPWGATSNPNLKAEKGKNAEVGLTYNNQTTLIQWSLFQNRIKNFISLDDSYIPQNLSKAKITGSSLSAQHKLGDITLRGDITYQSPKDKGSDKQLSRRAKVFGNLGIDYAASEKLTLSANQHLHGHSYDDATNNRRLGGYGITSLSAIYQITPQWNVSLNGDNIFDKKYTTAYGYNTPGASIMLKTRYNF